jgi:nitroreductase
MRSQKAPGHDNRPHVQGAPNHNGWTATSLTEKVTHMQLIELIDRATQAAGSQAELARLIGAQAQHVTNWKAGTRPCPPEDIALMANVAGLDPEDALVRAVIDKHAGTKKGDLLTKALGNVRRATGAVVTSAFFAAVALSTIGLSPAPSQARSATAPSERRATMCRTVKWRRRSRSGEYAARALLLMARRLGQVGSTNGARVDRILQVRRCAPVA